LPVFSLIAILEAALLRLRLQNRCGLGQGRNLPFLDGNYLSILPFFVFSLNDAVGRYRNSRFLPFHATLYA
jgi:hypothetical protein